MKILRNKDCKECPQNKREDVVWNKGYQDGFQVAMSKPQQSEPLPEEIGAGDDWWVGFKDHKARNTIDQIIRYLKSRED